MAKKIKQYDYNELQQLDTDELLRLYNRTAERVNKQVTRLKNAGIYDETAALYDVQRAPVYRTERAKNRALQNVEQLTEDILALQERGRGELTASTAAKEIKALKVDIIVMLKGSHIGGTAYESELVDKIWKSITPEDISVIKRAKERYRVATADKLFYEIQTRLKYYEGTTDMPQFQSKDEIINYIKTTSKSLPSNELPPSQAAPKLAENYTKRW